MNKFVIAFLFILTFSACQIQNKDLTIVSGTIIHQLPRDHQHYIYLYRTPDTLDLLHLDKVLSDSAEINSDGVYHFKLTNWHQSGFFDLKVGDQVIARNYFLAPGEKIKLDFDVNASPARLLGYEPSGKYNRFLQVFSDTFYRSETVKKFYYVESNYLLAPDYASYIDKRHQDELLFAKEMLDDASVDPVFKTYLQSEIDYQWANDKIAFLWKKWIRNEEVPLDSSYFNFKSSLKIDNPEALMSPAYLRFLHLYIRELHRQLPLNVQKENDANELKCEIAKQNIGGLAYKIALLYILEDELSNVTSLGEIDQAKLQKVNSLADKMANLTNDEAYIRYLKYR